MRVVAKARAAGLALSAKLLFLNPTIAGLAAVTTEAAPAADTAPVVGDVPLTPVQHAFFAAHPTPPHRLAQSTLVELAVDADPGALSTALRALVRHHDALRLRFEHRDGRWHQHNAPADDTDPLQRVDLSAVPDGEVVATMDKAASAVELPLGGPLFTAVLFDLGPGRRPWLFTTAHHLVVDAVSWRVLTEDLERGYSQAVAGKQVDLGPKTTSFRDWSHALLTHARGGGVDAELDHWRSLSSCPPLPVDLDGPNLAGSTRVEHVRLTAAETATLLRESPAAFRAGVDAVLLTALAAALGDWTGHHEVAVDVEGHGRQEIADGVDLSRTVGWFTAEHPVVLPVPDGPWPDAVRAVRRALRSVPGKGIGHGLLRHLVGADGLPGPSPVLFNYHGTAETPAGSGLYHAFHDPIGSEQNPADPRTHLLEVVGAVRGGVLALDLYHSAEVHDIATVRRLADGLAAALRSIAAHLEART
jgi:non-ribosomal peptide synthase protein (TIGR01720 family)